MKRIAIIGLGHQTRDELLPALLRVTPAVKIVAVCDPDNHALEETLAIVPKAHPYTDENELFRHESNLDCIVTAVPHVQYPKIVRHGISRGIRVIKEKPFAMNFTQANAMHQMSLDDHVPLFILTKRSDYPSYVELARELPKLGTVYQFQAKHFIPNGNIYTGWRSDPKISGGGVFLDLGYHLLERIVAMFGMPVGVKYCGSNIGKPGFVYPVEDSATILFQYAGGMHGVFQMGCLSGPKEEYIEIRGTNGTLVADKNGCRMYGTDGHLITNHQFDADPVNGVARTLERYLEASFEDSIINQEHHLDIMQIIESVYANEL